MKFEQWKRHNEVSTCVIFKSESSKKPCYLCGTMTTGVVVVDHHRVRGRDCPDTVVIRDLKNGQSICCICTGSKFSWEFLTEQSVRNAHWRSLRTNVSKKLFRIRMLRAMYQRGRAKI